MSDNHSEKIDWKLWGFAIGAGVLLLAGFALTFYDWSVTSTHSEWNNPGIRGDFYGGHLAAASSLAGTLLLFTAVLLQRNELRLQRKELKESQRIATEQAQALSNQTEELKLQNVLNEYQNDVQLMFSVARFAQEVRDNIITHHGTISKAYLTKPELTATEVDTAIRPIIASALDRIVEIGIINVEQSIKLLTLLTSLIWWQPFASIKVDLMGITKFRAPQLLQDEYWINNVNSFEGNHAN